MPLNRRSRDIAPIHLANSAAHLTSVALAVLLAACGDNAIVSDTPPFQPVDTALDTGAPETTAPETIAPDTVEETTPPDTGPEDTNPFEAPDPRPPYLPRARGSTRAARLPDADQRGCRVG